jgi:hypothetical protein
MAFKNVLRVFYKRIPLSDLFARYGDAVGEYGAALDEICATYPELRSRLTDQERDAQTMASTEPLTSFSHTGALLAELATAHEWGLLRAQAERHVDSPDLAVAIHAKRMLALSLAHSEETADKAAAAVLYRSLAQNLSEVTDVGNLVTLLIEVGSFAEAKAVLIDGIKKFPSKSTAYFFEIGLKIVEAMGDRTFRKTMEEAIVERGQRD